jgi:hypothetical protein
MAHGNLTVRQAPNLSIPSIAAATLTDTGEVDISGRRYVTAKRLATLFHVTARTLLRWDRARIGPPKIKIGRLRLYDLAKLPEWLEACEIQPTRRGGDRK